MDHYTNDEIQVAVKAHRNTMEPSVSTFMRVDEFERGMKAMRDMYQQRDQEEAIESYRVTEAFRVDKYSNELIVKEVHDRYESDDIDKLFINYMHRRHPEEISSLLIQADADIAGIIEDMIDSGVYLGRLRSIAMPVSLYDEQKLDALSAAYQTMTLDEILNKLK